MKNISLSIVLILCAACSFAQQPLYLKAAMGTGISGVSSDLFPGGKKVLSESVQLNAGFEKGKFQYEAGIIYLQANTDFRNTPVMSAIVDYYYPPNTTPGPVYQPELKYAIRNSYLMLPVTISYGINKGRKISFYPGAGIEAGYNFEKTVTLPDQVYSDWQVEKKNTALAMLLLKFDAQYKVNKQWSAWCGVAWHQMITSLSPADGMRDFAFVFNAGARYDLHIRVSNRETGR